MLSVQKQSFWKASVYARYGKPMQERQRDASSLPLNVFIEIRGFFREVSRKVLRLEQHGSRDAFAHDNTGPIR